MPPEPETRKKTNIHLPSKFLLTDKGLTYCARMQIPIRDLATYEGRKHSGFFWESFKAPLVQKLVVNQFVEAIDIERAEFLTKRNEIIDMTKLLVYGIFYKKFKPTLNKILYENDIVRKLVGSKHRNADGSLSFKPQLVNTFMRENDKSVRTLKSSLLFDPYALINEEKDTNDKEKDEKKRIVRKFIDHIDDATWFLFHYLNKTDAKQAIISQINDLLVSFLKRTKIADYTALMLMEVAQNAEKKHFEVLAKYKKAFSQGEDVEEQLQNREFRELLIKHARQSGTYANLHYRFDGDAASISRKLKLQISVTNRGVIKEAIRRNVQDKTMGDDIGFSLASYYKKNDPAKLGAGLGMHYLAYLQKACVQENIRLDARIHGDSERDKTYVLVYLYL